MQQTLFTITCTTCEARLNVRDQAAIGAILSCPKCESMVEVVAPPDWQPVDTSSASTQSDGGIGGENSPLNDGLDLSQIKAVAPAPEAGEVATDSVVRPPKLPKSAVPSGESAVPEQVDRPVQAAAGLAGAIPGSPDVVHPAAPATSPLAARATWTSPAELLFRKWILWAAVPVAGIVVAVGGWAVLTSRGDPDPVPEPVAVVPDHTAPRHNPPPVDQEPKSDGERSIGRWLPNQAKLVFLLRIDRLVDRDDFHPLVALADSDWESSVARLARAFGLKVETIQQLTWSSTDLSAWADNGIVVIELGERQDATVYRRVGTPVDINLEGADCRRLDKPDWPHPYAVLDRRTIVTGSEDQLRQLADRTEPALASVPIARFFQKADAKADALFAVDLAAARAAGWKLPASLMDIWPPGMAAWHAIWELPAGLGVTFRASGSRPPGGTESSDRAVGHLGLMCEARSVAEKTHAALEQLIPAAQTTLAGLAESLTKRVETGQITAPAADRYQTFLEGGLEAVKVSHREVVDETVWVRFDWESDLSNTVLAAIDSRGEIRDDWLAAAWAADTQRQGHLLTGLAGHQKAEGHFPPGASGGALLPPETRLSWIATMLPYLGHRDWYPDLQPAYPWNGTQNRPVTQRCLEAVVNPGLPTSKTEAGFPVTHYVGVAGVGAGAGKLPADDPKAGVFGFSRSISPREIPDGASNTLAILGVSDHLGAWASGGAPTVRALTKRPYVNGPDGFGSGQPGGMTVGMADGSVRFFSKDMDPTVLEQLATIGGGEKVSAAALSREPAGPIKPRPDLPSPEPQAQTTKPQEGPPEAVPDSPPPAPMPVELDVQTRLETMIPKIEIAALPLADAATLLSQIGSVQITFDLDTMAQLGINLDDPVTLKQSASSLAEILDAILAPLGLTYLVEGNQVLVTSPQRKENPLRQMRYTVSDLTGVEPAAVAELADLALRLVAPESWRASGGRGTMEPGSGVLNVLQTDAVHHELVTFCERLRLARGLPFRSRGNHARFSLSTRPGMAAENLSRPVSLNFREPAPLRRIVSEMEKAGGVNIHINWLMLVGEGLSAHTTATLTAHQMPLAEALSQLLQPLGLAYRVISVDTIEITTRKAAMAKLDLEFFPVADLLDKGLAIDSLTEPIKEQLAPDTWSDAGGPGVLYFDQLSKCLIVLQPQQTQVSIEILLAGVRAKLAPKQQPAEQ